MPRRSGAIFSGLVKRFVWFSWIGSPVVFGRFRFGFWDLGFYLEWIVCRFDNTRLRRLFDA